MVKVSICIPAYNNEAAVSRLLESIEKQNYKDYEVIISDDSQGDGIKELCNEKTYIQYYKNHKSLGAAANWNNAIRKSKGEYIKIMHHDDWFTDENSLWDFVEMLEQNPEACLAFSGTVQAENEKCHERFIGEEEAAVIEKDYRNLYLGNTIGAPSAVIVRKMITDTGELKNPAEYDEKLTWLVDMDYYMQLLKQNPHFAYTRKALVSIGVGQEQLTERCRDNGELNVFEYGYVFKKFSLVCAEEYREKLLTVYLENGKDREDMKQYGIPTSEYKKLKRKKFLSKIKWKLGLHE